jgi:hypothetical protein
MATLADRIRALFFPIRADPRQSAARSSAASVSVRVDDSPGWSGHQPGPLDRPWSEYKDDQDEALEAWRKNFIIRRVVTLIRSYVIGGGITISSTDPAVDRWLRSWWNDPQNHMAQRLGPWCDELTRSGEVFVTLHTNRLNGISYVRLVPASSIREIETAPNDYEIETRYGEMEATSTQLRWWNGPGHRNAFKLTRGGALPPVMLHYAVNRPVGATRGEGDLAPILPWALRYSEWLKDRVRLNRIRTRQGILDVTIADDTIVEQKRQQLRTQDPLDAGIYVHGPGEETKMHSLEVNADEAGADGQILRLAIATGANAALHYLGEGEAVNYSTAKEMGEPTSRFFTERQNELCAQLINLATAAYLRAEALGLVSSPPHAGGTEGGLQLVANVTEVARADNISLASAANQIAQAINYLAIQGWMDKQTAITLMLKFAGEAITEDQLAAILDRLPSPPGRRAGGEVQEDPQ